MTGAVTPSVDPIPVLLYHRIADDPGDRFAVPPSLFREHIEVIAACGRAPTTISELATSMRGGSPSLVRPVAITIDDGFEETPLVVRELSQRGLPVTLYVTTGTLDRPGLLSTSQLRAIGDMGSTVELGAHSVSHPHLDSVALADARREVSESKRRLETLLERSVDTFAYPHGSYDASVRAAVIDAGYGSAAAVKNAFSHDRDDPWAIARCTITAATSPERVAEILEGRGAPLAWRRDRVRTRAARTARRIRRRVTESGITGCDRSVQPTGRTAAGPAGGATAVRVVDLDQPIADIALPPARSGRGYESLLVVPRLHGSPLGTLYLDLRDPARAPREELFCAIWDRVGDEIRAHLRADGVLPPRGPEDFTPPSGPCTDMPLREGPMASVIVTTCADADTTVRCLNAVLAMAYTPFEVIVVDNRPVGSAVRSAVRDRFGADPRVRIVDEVRPGLAVARNTGLREAEGEFIGVIDDDVLVDRDWLGRIARRFEVQPGLSCVTGLILPAELETSEQALIERFAAFGKGFSRRTFSVADVPDADRLFPYAGGQFGSGANTALRAEAVDRLGGYEERLGAGTPARGGEDLDLFIRWLLAGAKIEYEPAALVWHRHPAAAGAARRQAINYGIGLSAMLTHRSLACGERARLARAAPAGIAYLRDGNSRRNRSRGEQFPRSLTMWEALGLAAGPFAYLASRARFRQHARSAFTPSWIDEAELASPLMDRSVPRGHDGRRYSRARLLVRNGGRPRGFLELDLPTGTLRAESVKEAASGLVRAVATPAEAPPERAGRPQATDVSVVVCTRDRPASLLTTLRSVLDASPGPLEVLVIDSAPSTAGAKDVVLKLDDPRVRYVHEPVPGLSRARNRGLEEARGEIVAFTDDDVRVDAGWLRGLKRGFAQAPDVACVTGLVAPAELETAPQQMFESGVGWTADCSERIWAASAPPPGDVLFPYTAGRFGTGANFALRREPARAVGPFDEALGAGTPCGGGEDLDMFLRVLLHGFKLAYQPTALVWHHHRREPEALRAQMFNYGVGLSAYACKHLLRSETRAAVVRRLPRGVLRAGRLARRGGTSSSMPRTQMLGYVCGPVLYARSRRAVAERDRAKGHR